MKLDQTVDFIEKPRNPLNFINYNQIVPRIRLPLLLHDFGVAIQLNENKVQEIIGTCCGQGLPDEPALSRLSWAEKKAAFLLEKTL